VSIALSLVRCSITYVDTVEKARQLFGLAPGTPGLDVWNGTISRRGPQSEQLVLQPFAAIIIMKMLQGLLQTQ
jgi:hypothetical protein